MSGTAGPPRSRPSHGRTAPANARRSLPGCRSRRCAPAHAARGAAAAAWAAVSSTPCWDERSPHTGSPATVSATATAASRVRAWQSTRAPSAENDRAISRPRPRLVPVTSAVLPASLIAPTLPAGSIETNRRWRRAKGRRVRVGVPRRRCRGPGWVHRRLGRRDGRQPRGCDRESGRGHSRPPQLHGVGGVLAEQRDRAVRDVHQRGHEACRDIDASGPGLGQRDGARRRAGRSRSGSQAAARRRRRRPREHLGRAGAARGGRRRRAQARDCAEDLGPRTTTARRLAVDSARIDPKRALTDRASARRLSR